VQSKFICAIWLAEGELSVQCMVHVRRGPAAPASQQTGGLLPGKRQHGPAPLVVPVPKLDLAAELVLATRLGVLGDDSPVSCAACGGYTPFSSVQSRPGLPGECRRSRGSRARLASCH